MHSTFGACLSAFFGRLTIQFNTPCNSDTKKVDGRSNMWICDRNRNTNNQAYCIKLKIAKLYVISLLFWFQFRSEIHLISYNKLSVVSAQG